MVTEFRRRARHSDMQGFRKLTIGVLAAVVYHTKDSLVTSLNPKPYFCGMKRLRDEQAGFLLAPHRRMLEDTLATIAEKLAAQRDVVCRVR